MVQEAEEFADADKKVKGRVDARNALETYVYNLRSTMDDKLGDKLSPDDKDTVRPDFVPPGLVKDSAVQFDSQLGPWREQVSCLGAQAGSYGNAAAHA